MPAKKFHYQLLAGLLFFLMLMAVYAIYAPGAAARTLISGPPYRIGSEQVPSVAGHVYAAKETARQLIEERRQREKQMPDRDYSQEIIVKWKKSSDEVSKEALLKKCAAEKIHEKRDLSLLRVKDREEATAELKRSGRVEFVEPNYPVRMTYVPNDPLFNDQWALQTINAARAWDKLVPNRNPVIVAVVDSGIDFYQEDLQGRILLDGAWDFVLNDSYPLDLDGHGTEVAGIIAAATGNATGIAGTAGRQNVQILPLRVFNLQGLADTYLVSQAITYAVDNGAQVINLSLGGPQYSQVLADAVTYAWEHGAVVVAAAGNDSGPVSYPAALPHVIAVAASDGGDRVADFSNHGPQVMVAAPGVDVLTTGISYPGYIYVAGTSLAAPFVSAAAAIIKSQLPDAGPDGVAEIIRKGVVDIGPPGKDDYAGYGRLDLDLVAAQLADAGTPGSGTVTMTPAQMLQIVFNQPVKLDGNTASHFHLLTATGAELPFTLYFIGEVNAGETGGYTTFWLKPGEALSAYQNYTLQVDAGLTATSGQKLAETYTTVIKVVTGT
ncbi:MAG: cell wall-associated protease [Moorella sp. (in: firmicutes)]|nr:cell wall-associated protease [Moorella sp. (in: firmicutes)]